MDVYPKDSGYPIVAIPNQDTVPFQNGNAFHIGIAAAHVTLAGLCTTFVYTDSSLP